MKNRQNLALAVATVTIGVVAGIGAVILSLFLEVIEKLLLNFHETASHPYAWPVSPQRRVLVLAGVGIVSAVSWWVIRNKLKPTVSVRDAVAGDAMPVGSTILHTFTQMLFVGAGGSVGRELAPRELAAMLSQWWQRQMRRYLHLELAASDRRLLTAAAAGAGFAGVYIAPITGMLFSVEILWKNVSRRSVIVSLAMSVIATFVGSWLKGFNPYYLLAKTNFTPQNCLIVLVIGPVCGVLGALFRRGIQRAGMQQAQRRTLLWQLPLVALLTGIIAVWFPQVTGNGRALAQMVFDNQQANLVPWLLLSAAIKALVTLLSLKAGAAGGTLTPSIAIGAAIGATVGTLMSPLLPSVPVWQCAMLGAAALLAVSQQAPLMAMFMLFEVSHLNYSALLPMGLGIVLAMVVANWFLPPKQPQVETGEAETAERLQAKVDRVLENEQ
ncbi:chloride channel protein [Lacticaseibacillus baoqingensis]|uniref:Chloride channel protein n=1 Tax=Lacticaseibacillus baoqingensis TaxID=2486013 RepID=A0ABW4E6W5_9LACO|nr:chloride channel protein [Lacticaseibacillus baoqingensis]